MSLATMDIFHVLIALSLLLSVAHLGAFIANKIGIPPMVGELTAGLLAGATVLKRFSPDVYTSIFPASPSPHGSSVGFCSQIGLLLLLFIGGRQLRKLITPKHIRAVSWIGSLGVIVPVISGLLILHFLDVTRYMGKANHLAALEIVLLIELAITSIPVITRIFIDLDLMNTRLARIVLSVAVIEDVLLYIALSIALGLAQADPKADASIPSYLGLAPDSTGFIIWHVVASIALLAAAAWGFGDSRRKTSRLNLISNRSPLGWTLVSILSITVIAMFLGLAPMFGALVAGIIASTNTEESLVKAQQQIETVGSSFFIPIYFALIGMSLDLIKDFDWGFTLGILAVGCVVKYGGSFLGAKLAGEQPEMAHAVSISVNARGGPGLVVASTAFAAGITSPEAYTSLVILAVLSSTLAAVVLARELRHKSKSSTLIRNGALDPWAKSTISAR